MVLAEYGTVRQLAVYGGLYFHFQGFDAKQYHFVHTQKEVSPQGLLSREILLVLRSGVILLHDALYFVSYR